MYKTSSGTYRALARAYALIDVAFVLGDSAKQVLVATWPITAPIHIIPHGDENIFASTGVPGADGTGPVVLSFGTITKYKGIDTLFEAWPMVRARVADAELFIVGALMPDQDESVLRAQAAKLPGVTLRLEYIPVDDVPTYFAQARCVVLPYKRSSQSGVAHLAHTMRRAVVATKVGDIPSAVSDGISGLLVDPNEPEALAAALVKLLTDARAAKVMGDDGARSLPSWDTVAALVRQGLR
jgi:glycosyltransferase involved in cell wall biosynthesis